MSDLAAAPVVLLKLRLATVLILCIFGLVGEETKSKLWRRDKRSLQAMLFTLSGALLTPSYAMRCTVLVLLAGPLHCLFGHRPSRSLLYGLLCSYFCCILPIGLRIDIWPNFEMPMDNLRLNNRLGRQVTSSLLSFCSTICTYLLLVLIPYA